MIFQGLVIDDNLLGLELSDSSSLAPEFAFCRICGATYPGNITMQTVWLDAHNDLHTPDEHCELEISHRLISFDCWRRIQGTELAVVVLN